MPPTASFNNSLSFLLHSFNLHYLCSTFSMRACILSLVLPPSFSFSVRFTLSLHCLCLSLFVLSRWCLNGTAFKMASVQLHSHGITACVCVCVCVRLQVFRCDISSCQPGWTLLYLLDTSDLVVIVSGRHTHTHIHTHSHLSDEELKQGKIGMCRCNVIGL